MGKFSAIRKKWKGGSVSVAPEPPSLDAMLVDEDGVVLIFGSAALIVEG